MKLPLPVCLVLVTAISALSAYADVKLPAIISDHMVLEKSANVPIWGKAEPGEEVAVTLNGQTAKATAEADGKWMTALDLSNSAPGPFGMTVEGKNKLVLADVVIGEVWVASGQSNMGFTVARCIDAGKEIAQSSDPLLREFQAEKRAVDTPMDDAEGRWVEASPETTGGFSAAGYFFARKLRNELKVPVGIVHASWGGSPSEAWTSPRAIDSVPDLKEARDRTAAAIREFPDKLKRFTTDLGEWVTKNGREDRPVADAAAYAGADVSTKAWIPVKIPGAVSGRELPDAGAVWLRKDVEVPAPAKLSLNLPIDGFDSVYWNGKLLKQTGIQDYPGDGAARHAGPFDIPAGEVKQGRNVLAIRLYEPVGPAKFPREPKAGASSLAGVWLAKAEYDFPALSPKEAAAAPPPAGNPPAPQNRPGWIFNGMIHPILPYAIRGVIWYQGETNARRAYQYRMAFPLLITDWRQQWNQGDFPFYFCQLPNNRPKQPEPGDSEWAELRDAQSSALSLPNTGQAVLVDIGESGDIHPRNKKDVGDRLAIIALARDYNKSVPYSGPVYDSMKIEDGKAILIFKHAENGLVARPLPQTYDIKSLTKETAPIVRNSPASQLEGFAICGEDKKWVWADARIQGNTVVVSSDKVSTPVAVRYAWADNPTCNLSNSAGLPASPFRTDDFTPLTRNAKY